MTRTATAGVQHRAATLQLRADDSDGMTVAGLAVPFGVETELWRGLFESIAPGAIESDDGKLFARHSDPIGTYTGTTTDAGYEYEGRISDTALGRDAAILVRDGVLDKASIGFTPLEWTETRDEAGIHIRHTRIHLREISLVPHPAYTDTTATARKDNNLMDPITPPQSPAADIDARALAGEVETLRRSLATLEVTARPSAPETRSAGTLIRAAVLGDTAALETLQRAYTGGTSGDDFGTPTWAADLTRLAEEADDLTGLVAESPLPATGMTLEHGRLKDNTVSVAKQAAEGDAIPLGNLSVETVTTPVDTYAGGSELSLQEIKRSQAPLLDIHLRAMALEAGKSAAAAKLAKINAVIAINAAAPAAHVTLDTSVATATWQPWVAAIVAARKILRRYGLGLSGLALPEADWIAMAEWTDSDGRPILTPQGGARDVGTFAATTLDGQLLQIPTRLVSGLTKPAFLNPAAIRHYKAPIVQLQQAEILSLTEAWAVYQFGAVADEIPGAVVPVVEAP